MDENENQDQLPNEEHCDRYLIFEIDSDLYGVNLIDIKEVLKNRPCKPIPYMREYFLGVINLRGRIVSVIDLRKKFKKPVNPEKDGFIIIIEAGNTQIVDDIVNVENIYKDEIDVNPHLELDFPMQFFLGVGKKEDKLINLIDLSRCLTKDDMRIISK